MMPMKQKKNIGQTTAFISAIGNAVVSILKIVGGLISGSIGLLSDGIHSLADVLSSIIVWVGLKISAKPPDVEHPYGHYKAENIASLFVALFIAAAGFETLWDSINKIMVPEEIILNMWIFSIPLISAFLTLLLAQYKKIVGKKIHSPSLIAEGEHSLIDTLASISVFSGLIFYSFGFPLADPIIGMVISVLIVWRSYEIGRDAILSLMDSLLEPEVLDKIREIVKSVDGVIDVEDVKARHAGGRILVDLTILVPPEVEVRRAYVVHDEIINRLKKEIPQIAMVMIEAKPLEPKIKKIAIPVSTDKGRDSTINDHFGKTPFIAILTLDENNNIEKIEIVKNKFLSESKGVGADLAEFLVGQGVSTVIVKNIGKTSYKILKSYGTKILRCNKNHEKISEIIQDYINNTLEIITQ